MTSQSIPKSYLSEPGTRQPRWPLYLTLVCLAGMSVAYIARVHTKPTAQMNWIMYAARGFGEEGYVHNRFTPPFANNWTGYSSVYPTVWYTHYPPLPYYTAGLLWKLGFTTKYALTVFHNLVAVGYLLLFYAAISLVLNNRIACMATLVQATHALFAQQCLENFLNLSLLFHAGAFLGLILALRTTRTRARWLLLALTWLCLFLDAFSTFDLILSSSFFVFAYTLWQLGPRQWKRVILIVGFLATASISAFLLHLLTNAWFFGSVATAFDDLCVKTLLGKSTGDSPLSTPKDTGSYFVWLAKAVWQRYGLNVFGLCGLLGGLTWFLVCVRRRFAGTKRYFIVLGIFCIANIAYWIAFKNLNYAQFRLVNASQWLPTYSLLVAGLLYFIMRHVRGLVRTSGFKDVRVLISAPLLLCLLLQAASNAYDGSRVLAQQSGGKFTDTMMNFRENAILEEIYDQIPQGAIVTLTSEDAVRGMVSLEPRTAFGLHNFPFTLVWLGRGDDNALFKLESLSLVRNVYLLSPSLDILQEDPLWQLAMANLTEAEIEKKINKSFLGTRQDVWDPILEVQRHILYKVRPPETNDLLPDRALLPSRLAATAFRIRRKNELQLIGRLFTGARVTRIEILMDGQPLGDALYPVPSQELARDIFEQKPAWFGMFPYPMPDEIIEPDYPEYEDNTHRFTFVHYLAKPPALDAKHRLGIKVYCVDDVVIEGEFSVAAKNSRLQLIQPHEVTAPVPH